MSNDPGGSLRIQDINQFQERKQKNRRASLSRRKMDARGIRKIYGYIRISQSQLFDFINYGGALKTVIKAQNQGEICSR
jgi:hypothetical protein